MSGLPEHLQGLLHPRAYPHPVQAVQLVETHISWVLLTGEFAYKIKRPVHYPFVDLRSAERREFLCHEEVRLNRRFAPEIYLGVCQITLVDGEAHLEGGGHGNCRPRRRGTLDDWTYAPAVGSAGGPPGGFS
jgi:aminoglycoside phosphotransferase family enzyme